MLSRIIRSTPFDAIVDTVDRAKQFSVRWTPGPDAIVEITLQQAGPDTTRVRILESGELENAEQSALAWRNALHALKMLAQEHSLTEITE